MIALSGRAGRYRQAATAGSLPSGSALDDALWLDVPIMPYSGLVAGTWNGIASDFDVTRGAVIRHHHANACALRHMSAPAFDLTGYDTRISLTEDAQALCASPK